MFPSRLKRRCSPQEGREELQGRSTIPRVPQMTQSIPGETVFPALPRLSCRGSTHTMVARGTALWKSLVGKPHGKASWESLEGKPRGKASRESHRSLDSREGKRDTAATAWEEGARAFSHSRRGLTPLGRLQKYPKIHVSTGDESSGSDPDSTQGLRPWYRWETNPERPPSNLHEDWTLLSPTDLVPDVPLITREHLSQLNKIQEDFPSRQDEALFR